MKGEVIDSGQCFTQGRLLQRAATEYRLSDGEVSMRRLGGKGLGRGTSKCRGNKRDKSWLCLLAAGNLGWLAASEPRDEDRGWRSR